MLDTFPSVLLPAVGGVALAAAAHPFLTYPLTLWVAARLGDARRTISPTTESHERHYAVCLSMHNEEAVVQACLDHLIAAGDAAGARLDLLVYADACTDRTIDIVRTYPQVKLLIGEDRVGKSAGLNRLMEQVVAPVVVFTDANVRIDPEAMMRLGPHFEDPGVGCVCGELRYTNAEESVTAGVGWAYWRSEEFVKQLESDTGSVMGADGSIFAIRRSLFTPIPHDIVNDMFISLSILCDGYRIVRAPDVIAYERSAISSAEEFHRKVRIACRAYNCHRLLWSRLRELDPWNLYKYLSHKWLRWFTFLSLVLGVAGVLGGLFVGGYWRAVAALVVSGAVLGLAVMARAKMALAAWEILRAFYATALGVWQSLRGRRYQTWAPANSTR